MTPEASTTQLPRELLAWIMAYAPEMRLLSRKWHRVYWQLVQRSVVITASATGPLGIFERFALLSAITSLTLLSPENAQKELSLLTLLPSLRAHYFIGSRLGPGAT